LIDDEGEFVTPLAKRLVRRDMQVAAEYSGEAGLEALRGDSEIDLVLLDMKMPGMDVIAKLRAIKKDFPLVEVIILTAHATVESAVEGMKLGAFDYLMKPADMDELMEKLDAAIARRREQQRKMLESAGRNIRTHRGK
jgi:DNA-binding NtrC family response regulator